MSTYKSNHDKPSSSIDFWKLFRKLPEAYLLFEANDPEYTIIEVNEARERLTGVSREASVGRPLFEVFPDMSEQYKATGLNELREYIKALITTGTDQKLETLRYDLLQADGSIKTKYWHPNYTLIRNDQGNVTHILASSRDITEETLAELEMANMADRLAAALEIGKVGSWLWDVDNDVVIGDRNLAKLFNLDASQVLHGISIAEYTSNVHPDDQQRLQAAIRRTVEKHAPFDIEFRTVMADGSLHWVLARGKLENRSGRNLFPGVIVDITERRDLQAQVELAHRQDQLNRRESKILQKRNEELETISRSKDEFVALASHQLRTPATAVKQYLGMVMQGYVGDITDIQAEMLQKAFESNERQIQIVNQILNAARVDTGRLVMTPMSMDVIALVLGIAEDMRSAMEQRQHEFIIRATKEPLKVVADLGYLRMAIENILHNAAIYTPDGGRIELAIASEHNQVRISVADNGVGIKKADLGKLFTKFSRIHNPLSVQAGGSGIGLYLAAEIIRLHGGSVEVTSKIKQGTTFAILLPLEQNDTKAKRHSSQTSDPEVTK